MPVDIGREMQLPMEQILGGPLQAVIKAQGLAAVATADFINNVGLEEPPQAGGARRARTVSFSFTRSRPNAAGNGVVDERVTLDVPLLVLLPIPFIRIETTDINFECTVASTTVDESATAFGVDFEASAAVWFARASLKVSYSHTSSTKDTVQRSSTLTVHIHAVQDEMPGGMRKMLDILETAIEDKPPAPAVPPPGGPNP
jgi:hypothetical protein